MPILLLDEVRTIVEDHNRKVSVVEFTRKCSFTERKMSKKEFWSFSVVESPGSVREVIRGDKFSDCVVKLSKELKRIEWKLIKFDLI